MFLRRILALVAATLAAACGAEPEATCCRAERPPDRPPSPCEAAVHAAFRKPELKHAHEHAYLAAVANHSCAAWPVEANARNRRRFCRKIAFASALFDLPWRVEGLPGAMCDGWRFWELESLACVGPSG